MNFILGLIVGAAIGGVVVYLLMRGQKSDEVVVSDEAKKKENLEKLKGIIAQNDKITNDMVQNELNISDATATRYLDALEKEGLIRQVGREGKSVYYEKL